MSPRAALAGLALILALGGGLLLVKHRVQALEAELRGRERTILATQEAIHVLRAEWAYLTRPERLAALNQRHFRLVPPAAAQIIALDDLPMRLDTAISKPTNPVAAGGASLLVLKGRPAGERR